MSGRTLPLKGKALVQIQLGDKGVVLSYLWFQDRPLKTERNEFNYYRHYRRYIRFYKNRALKKLLIVPSAALAVASKIYNIFQLVLSQRKLTCSLRWIMRPASILPAIVMIA